MRQQILDALKKPCRVSDLAHIAPPGRLPILYAILDDLLQERVITEVERGVYVIHTPQSRPDTGKAKARTVVADEVRKNPGATARQVSEQTGMSYAKVNRCLRELSRLGVASTVPNTYPHRYFIESRDERAV